MPGMVLSQVHVEAVVQPDLCTHTYLQHYAFHNPTASTRASSVCVEYI